MNGASTQIRVSRKNKDYGDNIYLCECVFSGTEFNINIFMWVCIHRRWVWS